jgi:hypothetical protein
MGRSVEDNFKKRFGDPMRVEVNYSKEKPLPSSEESYQNKRLLKAYTEVLKGILGREPTQDEITGETNMRERWKI